jgi:hypothetical protein
MDVYLWVAGDRLPHAAGFQTPFGTFIGGDSEDRAERNTGGETKQL